MHVEEGVQASMGKGLQFVSNSRNRILSADLVQRV